MSQVKVKIFLTIDEHGNYQAIGGSEITESRQHEAIALMESGIKMPGVNTESKIFNVMVDLPAPSEQFAEKT